MINFENKNILVLAPHADDGELGCGATIDYAVKQGANVYYYAFSVCEQSVPYGFSEQQIEREMLMATGLLNIPRENIIISRLPVRHLRDHRQEILQSLIDLKPTLEPDIVFMPCLDDLHQDHQVIAEEGLRAFKSTTIFSYELPWNNLTFESSGFIKLEQEHIEAKVNALAKYETQKFRNYTDSNFIFGLARTRGVQIGATFAEAFQVVRLVL